MEKALFEMLREYSAGGALPMHMPGHKRNVENDACLSGLGGALDLTEIDGFSNLHDPEGMLSEKMAEAAALWGSRRAWWLIGGSTAGLLAGVFACCQPGDTVLMARNCHKAVYHAMLLRGVRVRFLAPDPCPDLDACGKIPPETLETAFRDNPHAGLVVVTSPTYEGVSSDLPALAEVTHRHGAKLLIDSAHGAHLGFSDFFGAGAVQSGGDLVVQSLHKTLPSLTQTGLLHVCSHRVDCAEVGFWLNVFETSSPSYLLMASIDGCVRLLREQGEQRFFRWQQALEQFQRETAALRHLTFPLRGLPDTDPSKIVISTRGTNCTGPELMDRLRREYQIELEMSAPTYALAMTGLGDTPETLHRLAAALTEIDDSLSHGNETVLPALPIPKRTMELYEAERCPWETVPLEETAGRVAGDFLWAYPPGIPLIAPGEEIPPELPAWIAAAEAAGTALHTARQTETGFFRVLTGKGS